MGGVSNIPEHDLDSILVAIGSCCMDGGPLGDQVVDQQGGTVVQQELHYVPVGRRGRDIMGGASS